VGLLASGGTESILLAIYSYKEDAKARGIDDPEIIASITAHPAIDKACHYFGIRLLKLLPDRKSLKLTASIVKATL